MRGKQHKRDTKRTRQREKGAGRNGHRDTDGDETVIREFVGIKGSSKNLPAQWIAKPLGEVAEFINGRGFKPNEWGEHGLPIIRIQNLNGSEEFNYYAGEYDAKILVEPNNLLFSWSGSRGSSFGPKFWNRNQNGLLNYHTWKVVPKPQVDKRFLYHLLCHVTHKIEEKAHGAAGLVHIQKSWIEKWDEPIPPKPEQERIRELLDGWDRAIETLESLIAAKADRKRSLLQQLLTGRKRLPGFRGKWPVKKLGDLAQNSAATNRGKHGWDRLYGVTKADGMTPMREHVRGASNDRCKLVKPGWFAYNPMRLNIGSLARWQGDDEVMVSGDYVVFRCLEGKLDPRYFDHLRRSHSWTLFVNKSGSGSVRVRLYFKDIARFKIPCPPIEEQTAIADFLDTCDRELALHRQHLEALREQKRGLMQKLLTGEIRVKPD
ncbi:MAG: restriction endonuclease subunit S [Verrucomicrobiales bacterium]|nr:restriction endonuclease subunit S [Verrucomicrobiales bacterium]